MFKSILDLGDLDGDRYLLGVVLLLVLPRLVASRWQHKSHAAVDVPGALIITSATVGMIYGLINVGGHGWFALSTVLPLGACGLGSARAHCSGFSSNSALTASGLPVEACRPGSAACAPVSSLVTFSA